MKKTKTVKKLLSVFLSVLMLMSALSAAFPVFAATDSVIQELAEALKSDTVKNLSSYTTVTNTSTGSGANAVKTNTTAITLKTYAEYKEIVSLIEKLDAAVKDSDQYTKYAAFANDGSGRNCTDAGEIKSEITQSLLDSGDISEQEYADYNVATFLGNVLSMQQVTYLHDNNTKTQSNVPSRVYDITTVTTDDYQGYLAEKNSYGEVEDAIPLGISYTITMSRENYQTGSIIKTNHYHTAMNTANGVPTIAYGTVTNTEVKPVLNAYNAYLDTVDFTLTYEDMLDMVLAGTMEAFYNEFKTKYDDTVEYVGGTETFNKLFSDRASAIDNMLKSCASAMDVQTYLAIAEQWKAITDANPDYGVFNYGAFDYDAMVTAYNEFVQIYAALAEGGDELLTYLNKHGNISLEYYNNFTDNVAVYDLAATAEKANKLYNETKDTYQDMTTEEQSTVYSLLKGYLAAIVTYSEQVVNAVFPDGYDYLTDLSEKLYCETNPYVAFFSEKLGTSFIDASTKTVESTIADAKVNLDGLRDFYASLQDSLGAERADELIGELVTAAETLEDTLLNLLSDRFEAQVLYADSVYKALGEPTELNVQTFIKLKSAFSNLEADIITYLEEQGADDLIALQIIEIYNALLDKIYAQYLDFAATYGFSVYEQTELDYASRDVYINDKVKTESYDVTEEALNNIIAELDTFLTSDTFTDLIGGTDLKTTLTDAVKGAVFTDSLINTVVNLLYPLVLGEFEKVWETLPMTVEYSGMNVKVNYLKDLYTILNEGGLNIYPQLLGEMLPDSYPEAKQALINAKRNWQSVAIYDKDSGALTLNWGVDDAPAEEKEAVFYQAFADAMSGLKPLIMAILCNQEWNSDSENIATGSVQIIITITLNVALNLNASPNSGYVNTLVPVFEALGCENIPTADEVESYTDLVDVAKAIFAPVFSLVDQIGEQPVDTVLSILPNLLYALSFDMITPILSMLKTRIAYTASANLVGTVMSDGVDIDVGEMLNLEDLGIDLSKGLGGILDLIGIDIPEIDASTVATLGELTTRETVRKDWIYDNSAIGNKAYTIEADKADVGYYALTYAIELLKDTDALGKLLAAFLDEEQVASVLSVIESLPLKSTGDVIAALTELLNAEKYPEATFSYADFNTDNTDDVKESIVAEDSNFYSIYWTKSQATYVADNLIPFVEKVCDLFGVDLGAELGDLVSSLYTQANVEAIVNALNGLLSDETVKTVIETISPMASIDLCAILNALMTYEVPAFEDGDKTAFVDSLVNYILPLVPVLKLFVLDDSVETLLDTVKIYGYNGYESAVIPVLEALGCASDTLTPYAAFKTLDDEAMLRAVLDPIFALVDDVLTDPVNKIVALLPNILYFIDNNGLQQAVDNLLRPVYVILDVIRPIYDVDLTINLNLDEILTDALAGLTDSLSIKFPGYSELSSMVQSLGTLNTYTSVTGGDALRLTVDASLTPEFVTVILRAIVRTVIFSTNAEKIAAYIRENSDMSDEQKNDIENFLMSLAETADPDKVLFIVFYVFFGLNTGVNGAIELRQTIADEIVAAFNEIGLSSSDEFKEYVKTVSDVLLSITASADDIIGNDPEGNSITSFFKKIFDFFRNLIEKILAIFKL